MHRYNTYHGQTVLEAELDAMFDDCENAEHDLATDTGHAQAATTASPDSTVYGGILDGLVVTATAGDDHVHVSAGVARDDQGRRVELPTAATVKITHVGSTPEGDTADAQPDGAAITSIGVGNYVVASLWIAYTEALTDPQVDLLGATVYYDVAESFLFEVQIGTGYANPPAAPPVRASLANSKVLLADIIVLDSAGNVIISALTPTVCVKDEDWDDLTGNYVTLTGRRSDWLACDQGADYPRFAAESLQLRSGTSRAAIRELIRQLQAQTSPSGTALIGSPAVAGVKDVQAYTAPVDLSVGGAHAAILTLLNAINTKVARGGDLNQALFDDFMYADESGTLAFAPDSYLPQTWGLYTAGGGGTASILPNEAGGVVQLLTSAAAGSAIGIQTGYVASGGGTHSYWWKMASGYPFPIAGMRFRIPALADATVTMGYRAAVNSVAAMEINAAGEVKIRTINSAGVSTLSAALFTITANKWYEYWLWVDDDHVFLRSTYDGSSQSYALPAGSFGTDPFAFYVIAGTAGAAVALDIDTVSLGDYLNRTNIDTDLLTGRPIG